MVVNNGKHTCSLFEDMFARNPTTLRTGAMNVLHIYGNKSIVSQIKRLFLWIIVPS
jgi:hypothetical protein